jgi:hypothetical protein
VFNLCKIYGKQAFFGAALRVRLARLREQLRVKPCQMGQIKKTASPSKRFAPSRKTRSLEQFRRGKLRFAQPAPVGSAAAYLEAGGGAGGRRTGKVEEAARWARPEAGAPEAASGELLPGRVHGDGHGAQEAATGETGSDAVEEPREAAGRRTGGGSGGPACDRTVQNNSVLLFKPVHVAIK